MQIELQVDWRSLLNSIRVEWKDRGANCTANNVNIACPWCRNDPSFHLALSETTEAYYCWRNSQHAGRNFVSVLVALHIHRSEAIALLNSYSVKEIPRETLLLPPPRSPDQLARDWSRFRSASENKRYLDYLAYERGFSNPRLLAERYQLQYAPNGIWAQRLLIPYRAIDGRLLTWTGRALDNRLQPRYLTEKSDKGLIYVPPHQNPHAEIGVIVEGPIDALKIASACRRVLVVALTGSDLNDAKFLRIKEALSHQRVIYQALDNTVPLSQQMHVRAALAEALSLCYIARLPMPKRYKDPAEIPEEEMEQWLSNPQIE